MEKKQKVKQAFKYIFLGLALTTYGFIFYQSAIVPSTSKEWNSWAKNIWTGIINDMLGIKEKVVITKPESVTLKNEYYPGGCIVFGSNISGYEENELPIACEKWLMAEVSPKNTTDYSVSFSATPSNKVNLIQSGDFVYVEALELGEVTIKATCNADASVYTEYKYTIVEKKSDPHSIYSISDQITMKLGESKFLDFNDCGTLSNYTRHYYDSSNFSISSNNESVIEVREDFIKAVGVGNAEVVISNGEEVNIVNVVVSNNTNTISHVISIDIQGEMVVHVRDLSERTFDMPNVFKCNPVALNVNFETDTGDEPTDNNVIWSVDNPLAAYVTPDGHVYGNAYISDEDVTFTVRATSVDNPSIYKDFIMTESHITPTKIVLSPGMLEDGVYRIANTGKLHNISLNCTPENVTKLNYEVIVSDPSIVDAEIVGDRIYVIGLKEGNCTLKVVSKDNPNVESETLPILVKTRGYINDDNLESFSLIVRKYISGHAFLFMFAAIFTSLYVYFVHMDKSNKVVLLSLVAVLGIGLIMGIISECIQLTVPGRYGTVLDVLIDLSGTAIGILIIFAIAGIRILVKKKKAKKAEIVEEK